MATKISGDRLRTKRALALGAFGGLVSAVSLPIMWSVGHLLIAASPDGYDAIVSHWRIWESRGQFWPWVSWWALLHHSTSTRVVIAGIVLTMAGMGIWGYTRPTYHWGGPPPAGQGQHGTARWRKRSTLAQTLQAWPNRQGAPAQGIVVGQSGRSRTWVTKDSGHTLLIGSTRSGKDRRIILPSLGLLGAGGQRSLLITDPKSELFDHTAAFLKNCGYRVRRLDFRNPREGESFNPLTCVSDALHCEEPDWARASQCAWDIAHILTPFDEHSGDLFWAQSQESLTAALILGIAQAAPKTARNLSSVYTTLLELGRDEGKALDQWMQSFPERHPARFAYGTVGLSSERTRTSILTGTAAQLRLFSDPDIAWMTSEQIAPPSQCGSELEAVFLIVPDDRSTRYPVVNLYLSQTLQSLSALAEESGGQLPQPVMAILDEFGNLPKIPDFDKLITVAAGRGIQITMVVQDLQQLKSRYGDAAQTIEGNASTWIYLMTQNWETAQLLSKKMGEYTTKIVSQSVPHVSWWNMPQTSSGAQDSHGLTGRPLLTTDELMRWPEGYALILQNRQYPAKMRTPDLSDWPNLAPIFKRQRASGKSHSAVPHYWWPQEHGQDAMTQPGPVVIGRTTAARMLRLWQQDFGNTNTLPPQEEEWPEW